MSVVLVAVESGLWDRVWEHCLFVRRCLRSSCYFDGSSLVDSREHGLGLGHFCLRHGFDVYAVRGRDKTEDNGLGASHPADIV